MCTWRRTDRRKARANKSIEAILYYISAVRVTLSNKVELHSASELALVREIVLTLALSFTAALALRKMTVAMEM